MYACIWMCVYCVCVCVYIQLEWAISSLKGLYCHLIFKLYTELFSVWVHYHLSNVIVSLCDKIALIVLFLIMKKCFTLVVKRLKCFEQFCISELLEQNLWKVTIKHGFQKSLLYLSLPETFIVICHKPSLDLDPQCILLCIHSHVPRYINVILCNNMDLFM